MADEADLGNDRAEQMLEAAISEARYRVAKDKEAGGVWPHGEGCCKNCGDRLVTEGEVKEMREEGVVVPSYCDEDCRDDHWKRIVKGFREGKCVSTREGGDK